MYLFINEHEIVPYNGDILKRYVGNKLVKVIANPTKRELKEFGYMELIKNEQPIYDEQSQYLVTKYEIIGEQIIENHQIVNIEEDNELNSEI